MRTTNILALLYASLYSGAKVFVEFKVMCYMAWINGIGSYLGIQGCHIEMHSAVRVIPGDTYA